MRAPKDSPYTLQRLRYHLKKLKGENDIKNFKIALKWENEKLYYVHCITWCSKVAEQMSLKKTVSWASTYEAPFMSFGNFYLKFLNYLPLLFLMWSLTKENTRLSVLNFDESCLVRKISSRRSRNVEELTILSNPIVHEVWTIFCFGRKCNKYDGPNRWSFMQRKTIFYYNASLPPSWMDKIPLANGCLLLLRLQILGKENWRIKKKKTRRRICCDVNTIAIVHTKYTPLLLQSL